MDDAGTYPPHCETADLVIFNARASFAGLPKASIANDVFSLISLMLRRLVRLTLCVKPSKHNRR